MSKEINYQLENSTVPTVPKEKPIFIKFQNVPALDSSPSLEWKPPDVFQPDPPPPSQPPPLVISVLVPVVTVLVVALVIVAAVTTWKRYNKRICKNTKESQYLYEEQRPLKPVAAAEKLDLEMQIIQEGDKKLNETSDDHPNNKTKSDVPMAKSTSPTQKIEIKVDQNDHSVVLNNPSQEGAMERPKTLKFLAASVAYQYSTVAAVKRLPYTPDPDASLCVLSDASPRSVNGEAQDQLTPLTKPKRGLKMKPRGLLERRGSNVALTITLRSGEKSNSASAATVVNTRSPKPLAYLQKASCVLTSEDLHSKSCDTLQIQQEFWEIPMNHPSEKNFNVPGHGTKNRYRTILPNEHSRVKLSLIEGDSLSSYINANYIRDCSDLTIPDESENRIDSANPSVTRKNAAFIATQGPMTNTVADFWRMVWQENTVSVVMITKLRERKEKCAQYLPMDVDDESTYDSITVRVLSIKKFEHFTVRSLELSKDQETRSLHHFWYTTWMDHETPEKTRGLLELVQEVTIRKKPAHGPVVVHCSAGIGRTGCYIAVTLGCQQLLKTGKTDILRLVSQMRLDRGGMIQTWEQYQFVHQALSRYARILAGENVTTPSTTGSIRSPPGVVIGGAKTRSTLEQLCPLTPKHRRSLSDTNLPSPKESKTNAKDAAPARAPINSEPSSEKMDPVNGLKVDQPPQLPALSPRTTSSLKTGVTKSCSSPTIRSPFGRLCLQIQGGQNSPNKVDASNASLNGSLKRGGDLETKSEPLETNSFTFSANSIPLAKPQCNGDSPKTESTQRSQFSFDRVDSNGAASPGKSVSPKTTSSRTTPLSRGAHFFFPASCDS